MIDTETIYGFALRKSREAEEHRQTYRDAILCSAETASVYLIADMSSEDKAAMRKYLVSIGLATWVVPRHELIS